MMVDYQNPLLQWVTSRSTSQPVAAPAAPAAPAQQQVPLAQQFSAGYQQKQAAAAAPAMRSWNATVDGQTITVQAPDALSAQAAVLNEASRIRNEAIQLDMNANPGAYGLTAPAGGGPMVPIAPGLPTILDFQQFQSSETMQRLQQEHPGSSPEDLYQQFYIPSVANYVMPTVEQYKSDVAARRAAVEQYQADRANRPTIAKVGDWVDDFLHGATLGASDEIYGFMAGIDALVRGENSVTGETTFSGGFNSERDWRNATMAQHQAENLFAATVVEMLGGVTAGVALGAAGLSFLRYAKPTTGSMALRGALDGMIYGGIQGFNEGDSFANRIGSAIWGAGLGGLTGAAFGALAGHFAQRAAVKSMQGQLNGTDLRAAANANFDAARQAGVTIDPNYYAQHIDDIFQSPDLQGLGTVAGDNPHAQRVFDRLMTEMGRTDPTLSDLEAVRQYISNQVGSWADPSADDRLVMRIGQAFSDMIEGLPDTAIRAVNADPQATLSILTNARALWSQARKSEQVARIFQAAANATTRKGDPEGYLNRIRTGFASILNTARPGSPPAGFTAEEAAAMQRVVDGGPLERILVQLGNLAPSGPVAGLAAMVGPAGATYYGLTTLGIGPEVAGPAAAVTAGLTRGVGAAAKGAATSAGLGSADLARMLISGGIPAVSAVRSIAPLAATIPFTAGLHNIPDLVRMNSEK